MYITGCSQLVSLNDIRQSCSRNQLDGIARAADTENGDHSQQSITIVQENPHYIGKDKYRSLY